MTVPGQQRVGENVLVTGGRGFIGSHLVAVLNSKGFNVVSVDIQEGILPKPAGANQVTQDVRDRAGMEALFAKYKFQRVFDLASFTEPGLSAAEYRRNTDKTEVMVDMAARHKTPKYIFYSTQFVFRKEDQLPGGEEDYAPTEAYGESKAESERIIRRSLPRDQWLILRPSYIWGPGLERFRDGLLYRLAKKQFLVTNASALGRYYGYVETVTAQTAVFAEQEFATLPQKVYYISDDAISLQQFCNYLVSALGQGRAWPAPPAVIRALGFFGELLARAGLPAPINRMQAREMTSNFPIPIRPTLDLTRCSTDYPSASARTVKWALESPGFAAKIGRNDAAQT